MTVQATARKPTVLRPHAKGFRRATAGDAPLISRRRYYLYSFDSDKGWLPNPQVPCVDLENGQLYVNGKQIVTPNIGPDHISWLQHAKEANGTHYLAGHLHLHSNGLEAHGVVVTGDTQQDAVRHVVLATAIPSVSYKTQITVARYPAGTNPNSLLPSAWQDGLPLEVSYQQQVGESVPRPVVLLGGLEISDQCSWSVNDQYTVLNIALSDSDCAFAPGLYAQASLSFDATAINAPGVGYVRKTCTDSGNTDGAVLLWRASVATAANARFAAQPPLPQPARVGVFASSLLSTSDAPLTVNELMTLLPDDVVNEDANAMLMRNMKWAMGQSDEQKEWLAKFFSEQPPTIAEKDQQDLVRKSLDWYQNKFALSYLTQSFNSYNGPNQPSHRLDSNQALKLADFLKTGLAKDKDFNTQHQGIFIDAYIGTKPRLQQYRDDATAEFVGWAQGSVVFSRADTTAALTVPIGTTVQTTSGTVFMTQAAVTIAVGKKNSDPVAIAANSPGPSGIVPANVITVLGDQNVTGLTGVSNPSPTTLSADTGGLKWAKQLFNELTTGSQFILMVNRVAGAAGDPKALGPVNNFACLLTALDNSGATASNYFQSILSGVIVKLVPQVVHRDKDTIMQWLPATMTELLRKLADGELPQETEISQTEAKEMYQEFLKHQAEISAATADLLQSIAASGLVKQAAAAEEQFGNTIARDWPKLAKASKFMLAIGWIGGVASVITSLVKGDWKNMTDVERAEFVTNCVQLGVTGFQAVPLIWQGVKSVTLPVWNKLNSWWNAPAQQQQVIAQQRNVLGEEEPLLPAEARTVDSLITESQAIGTLGKGTIFERIFAEGTFTGALKIVGAVAAVAMAGYSLWQLINDVKAHGSVTTIVFDSLMFTANMLAAVCLVADLFVATSWLPIAGALLAIAGILIGFLAGFFEKPANPIDDWMVDHGIPFVNNLPSQTSSVAATQLRTLLA